MTQLKPRNKVLLHTPGIDSKLRDAWEGPYVVLNKLGPMTYNIDVGRAKRRVAHINTLKEFKEKHVPLP